MIAALEGIRIAGGLAGLIGAFVLMPILTFFLTRRFDPDWIERRWTPFEREAIAFPIFPLLRMSLYAPAVCWRFSARRTFGADAEHYDFRGRAGPVLHLLSLMYMICLGMAVIAAIVHQILKLVD